MTATRTIRSRNVDRHLHVHGTRLRATGFGPVFRSSALAQHVIGRLDHLEALGGFLVAGLDVGMVGLGEAAPGGLDLLEIGVGLELEHVERAHLVAAAAAVAGAAPAIMVGLAEGVGAALLVGLARAPRPRRSGLRNNSSCGCIRRRGARRNTSARGCWAIWARAGRPAPRSRGGRTWRTGSASRRGAVGAPARKSPVVRSLRFGHRYRPV